MEPSFGFYEHQLARLIKSGSLSYGGYRRCIDNGACKLTTTHREKLLSDRSFCDFNIIGIVALCKISKPLTCRPSTN
jgi:hypothetical protein